ncbi:MAG: ABC transporter ATP-binding protein, partial [Specibacter sp.]
TVPAKTDDDGAAAPSRWVLAVDAENHPQGWLAPAPPGATAGGPGTNPDATPDQLIPGGSLFHAGDPLRNALDAALSSPSGLGVAVDADGRVTGLVKASEVLAVIDAARESRN